MKIALTGASGFIGAHVLRALVNSGVDEIVAVGRTPPADEDLVSRFVPLDIRNTTGADYARMGSPDVLVHLAWGGLPHYMSLHHFEEELPAQYGFLKTMVEAGLPAIVAAGTCFEYGMIDGRLGEELAPRPGNPYAFAKLGLLRRLEFLKAELPFALTWARLFYMWGDGQSEKSLYPLLKNAAARGDRVFPMSGGEQVRDYLPVAEVARIIASLALLRADAGVVNVCSGQPVSIRALVERWIADEQLAITPDLGRFPYPAYEPFAFWGCEAKRKAILREPA